MFNILYNFIPLFITIISELIQTSTKSYKFFPSNPFLFQNDFVKVAPLIHILLKFILFFQSPFSSHPTKQYPINLLLRSSSPTIIFLLFHDSHSFF